MRVMCSVSSSYRYFCAGIVSSVRVVVSSVRTNRARCALYEKMLDYSMRKAFLEKAVVELVYKLDEKSNCKCLKR